MSKMTDLSRFIQSIVFSNYHPEEERMTMCLGTTYINMIQSPHPSKISIRKPNHQGMHLGCISLQTPPLLSIAYCVECRIMIITSSLHSKCISPSASISCPSCFCSPCNYVFQIFTTALTVLLHTGHTSTCLAHSSHATTCPQS